MEKYEFFCDSEGNGAAAAWIIVAAIVVLVGIVLWGVL